MSYKRGALHLRPSESNLSSLFTHGRVAPAISPDNAVLPPRPGSRWGDRDIRQGQRDAFLGTSGGHQAFSGGAMSWRMASNSVRILSSCPAILRSRSASLLTRSFCRDIVSRSRTNARMMAILTAIARSLLRTLESIATPCSVNALTLRACLMFEHVTICDMSRISSRVSGRAGQSGDSSTGQLGEDASEEGGTGRTGTSAIGQWGDSARRVCGVYLVR